VGRVWGLGKLELKVNNVFKLLTVWFRKFPKDLFGNQMKKFAEKQIREVR
jgi:hypothetical protein